MSAQYRLHFVRHMIRHVSPTKLANGLQFIADRALAGHRGPGWTYIIGDITTEDRGRDRGYTFRAWIDFARKNPTELDNATPEQLEKNRARLDEILEHARKAGYDPQFTVNPWIAQTDAVIEACPDDAPRVWLPKVGKIERGKFFDHIFDLDSQIRIILSAVEAARMSSMVHRFHCLLTGPPGCGKTETIRALAALLDSLRVHYFMLDATSTTQAGVKNKLLSEDTNPPDVILLEEIGRVPENEIYYLLSLMDTRGEVQRLTYRVEEMRRVPALVVAATNNLPRIERMMDGALLSRFSKKVEFPRPDRALIKKILEREVSALPSARDSWIEPTLEFLYDKRGVHDPRQHKDMCLSGGDALLTGEYQRDLEKTMPRSKVSRVLGVELGEILKD